MPGRPRAQLEISVCLLCMLRRTCCVCSAAAHASLLVRILIVKGQEHRSTTDGRLCAAAFVHGRAAFTAAACVLTLELRWRAARAGYCVSMCGRDALRRVCVSRQLCARAASQSTCTSAVAQGCEPRRCCRTRVVLCRGQAARARCCCCCKRTGSILACVRSSSLRVRA